MVRTEEVSRIEQDVHLLISSLGWLPCQCGRIQDYVAETIWEILNYAPVERVENKVWTANAS